MRGGAQLIVLIVVGAGLAIARYSTRNQSGLPPDRDDLVQVRHDDPRIVAAEEEARRRWPEFVAAFEARAPGRHCAVKSGYRVKGGKKEHMWAEVSAIDGQIVRGLLLDEPYGDAGLKPGDAVSVAVGEVEDWMLEEEDGTITGVFTEKALKEMRTGGK